MLSVALERVAMVFVSASADDARALRRIADPGKWLVVNVPDLAGARAVMEKLRPTVVVCDTDIEGPGCWRDLCRDEQDSAGVAFIVASSHADAALAAEVLGLRGLELLEKPFVVESVERVLGVHLHRARPTERRRPSDAM